MMQPKLLRLIVNGSKPKPNITLNQDAISLAEMFYFLRDVRELNMVILFLWIFQSRNEGLPKIKTDDILYDALEKDREGSGFRKKLRD
mmetsp:Transcript_9355/g.26836  ORF Transcript_9355/g.26836 Transcript_9355/m.26836 type:complete len:88 (+) Transcript_9355:3-266(+)